MTATQPPSVPTADNVFHLPSESEFDFYAPKYHYKICGHTLHVKIAAVLAVLVSFLTYLAINIFFIVVFRFTTAYFTLTIGCLVFLFFFYGCRQYNRWLVLAYVNFLGVYVIALIAVLAIGIFFLRVPDKGFIKTSDGHEIMLYKAMIGSSAVFFVINLSSIFIIYRLYKLFSDRKTVLTRSPHVETHDDYRAGRNFFTNIVRGSRRRESSDAPICVISYPPSCPPAYEAEPASTSTSPNTSRRPRRKPHRQTPRIVLPQYTDFRPDVYAEPPPYEEKPAIQNYI